MHLKPITSTFLDMPIKGLNGKTAGGFILTVVRKTSEPCDTLYHSHKKQKDSLETWVKLVVFCIYVENQAMLETILS